MRDYWIAFGAAFLAAFGLTYPIRFLTGYLGIVDRPNERSSHHIPTPRAGGLAIVATLFVITLAFGAMERRPMLGLLAAAVIAGVSFWDDVRSLPFAVRLVTQLIVATTLVMTLNLPVTALDLPGLSWPLPTWLGQALAILFIVGYCNFFNFMDGINGLAAGQAILTGGTIAVLLANTGAGPMAVLAAAAAGAAFGFLPHNFPSARIFMGDVGSVTLGFMLALLSQTAHSVGHVPWTAILLVHAVFLFDATFTLLKRVRRGERVWRPHREHNYQLLVRRGWSHPRTSMTLWVISAVCCGAGLVYAGSDVLGRWLAFATAASVLLALATLAHWPAIIAWFAPAKPNPGAPG